MVSRRTKAAALTAAAALAGLAAWQLTPLANAATAATVFVPPSGNDANAGTAKGAPVRTLARAQAVVRTLNQNMTGDVRVELAGGTYQLPAPLALTSRDSGTNGHNVVWTAASGAR